MLLAGHPPGIDRALPAGRPRIVRPLRTTGLIAVAIHCLGVAGCAPAPPPPSDPDLRVELGIPDNVAIHRVALVGQGDRTRVLPRELMIRSGDVVQFVSLDHRVYVVRFDETDPSAPTSTFLVDTEQDSPPPLVEEGARLVLTFGGAPTGTYAYRVEGNGGPVPGSIRVAEP